MKKKIHLITFTTQEDFEIYQQSKNIDSVTIFFAQILQVSKHLLQEKH